MTVTINGTTGITTPGTDSTTLVVNSNNISAVNSLGFRNRIINGDMRIDQRNAGASVTINTGAYTYTTDRWGAFGQAADGVYTVQRSTVAPAGFVNSLLLTVTTADASIGASQFYLLRQAIEGFNIADLGWGTASAQSVTLSFWVRSSLTGSFSGSVTNSAYNRSYPFSFTINAANTYEYKTITIPGDTTGTWLTDNSTGISLYIDLGSGSSNKSTANAWAGAGFTGVTGSVNLIGTSGATFYITGVQLEAGSVASPFERRDYGRELMMCQRYLQIVGSGVFGTRQSNDASYWYGMYYPKVSFRVKPTSAVATAAIKLDYPGTANYTQSSANAAIATFSSADAVALQCANFTSLVAFSNLVIRDDGGVIQLGAEL